MGYVPNNQECSETGYTLVRILSHRSTILSSLIFFQTKSNVDNMKRPYSEKDSFTIYFMRWQQSKSKLSKEEK
jgi:hypothetical protein